MELAGRVALVTGSARRVGKVIAEALAAKGMSVVVHYRASKEEAEATVAGIQAGGGRAVALAAELTDETQVQRLMADVRGAFGGLDLLVNSASTYPRTPFDSLTAELWNKILAENLTAPFLCARYAAPLLRERPIAKIVNIADWAGLQPYRDFLPYCVAKGAVITLTNALAKELAPTIRVNAICPGPVLPPEDYSDADVAGIAAETPLRRIGHPSDIAGTVCFLAEGTDFMTGAIIPVDGGRHLG